MRRCVLVCVCVYCWLFIFKDTEPSPLQDSFSVRQQGGLPGPPPVVPDPKSIDAQAAYRGRHSTNDRLPRIHCGVEVTELSTNKQHSLSGPNCFQALGSSPGLPQSPML